MGDEKGDEAKNRPLPGSGRSSSHTEDLASHEGLDEMARPGLEPGTPRFSEFPGDDDELPWLQGLS